MRRALVYTLLGTAIAFMVVCGGAVWVVEIVAHLAVGWYANLQQTLPRATVNAAGVALFAIALSLTAWLGHSTCRWLWQSGRPADGIAARPWRWKWTLVGLAGVMLMFVAGTAATGVVHQTGWLMRSPTPLLRMSPRANQIRCSSNLRRIGLGVLIYVHNGGHWPTSRAELARMTEAIDLTPDVFVCPAGPHERAPDTRPADWAAALDRDEHFSYLVAPWPLPSPDGEGHVMLYEPLDLHGDGINVLFDDAHVEWLDLPTAEAWLAKIEGELQADPATLPATSTTKRAE